LRAWDLFQQGWSQSRIAEALGVSRGAVCQWLKRAREGGGVAALAHRKPPGRTPRLTPAQETRALALLRQGAPAAGFTGDRWTRDRVRVLLQREFGVDYHPTHVGRLLAQWQWTQQRPQRRAIQRDEAAISQWREEEYPAREKKGAQEGRSSVFVDEAAFYLLPFTVATYAPRGETPVLFEVAGRDHLVVISAVTPLGQLYLQIHEDALRGPAVVRFLKHLKQWLPGPFRVYWDGASIHDNQGVQQFLAEEAGWIEVTELPGYAPDLNPDEGVWRTLKGKELANVTAANREELEQELRRGVDRIRHRPALIRGYFREAGYV
jgi:transposase